MTPTVYFRSLFSEPHIQAWEERQFTSFHHDEIPKEWLGALKDGKQDRADYRLVTTNGLYLPSARDTYFQNCVEQRLDWHELDEERKKVTTELCGVCAYENPAGAYWYGGVKPEESCRLVAFYGIAVFELGSESNGGVIAAVVKPIGGLMTPQEFVVNWCDGTEPPKPEGRPEDRNQEPKLSDENAGDFGEMPDIRRQKDDCSTS